MKSLYPRTYDYIYHLIEIGIDLDSLTPINERSIAANILEDEREIDLGETFCMDRITAHKMSKFLFSTSLESMFLMQDEIIKNVIMNCRYRIEDIFEAAELEWREENNQMSELQDLINEDNRERARSFDTHIYR